MQDIIKEAGFDISSADNGVFLPGEKDIIDDENTSIYSDRHLNAYISEVISRLQKDCLKTQH